MEDFFSYLHFSGIRDSGIVKIKNSNEFSSNQNGNKKTPGEK